MIAASRQRRQRHTNTRGPTVRQSQPSTSLPLQDTDVLQSQLWSAHTHTCSHTHTKHAANVHTLAPAQSDDLAAALHYNNHFVLFVVGGHCCKPREEENKDGDKKARKSSRARRKICRRRTPRYPSKGRSTFDEWETDTFNVELFQEGTPLSPGSVSSDAEVDVP